MLFESKFIPAFFDLAPDHAFLAAWLHQKQPPMFFNYKGNINEIARPTSNADNNDSNVLGHLPASGDGSWSPNSSRIFQ